MVTSGNFKRITESKAISCAYSRLNNEAKSKEIGFINYQSVRQNNSVKEGTLIFLATYLFYTRNFNLFDLSFV